MSIFRKKAATPPNNNDKISSNSNDRPTTMKKHVVTAVPQSTTSAIPSKTDGNTKGSTFSSSNKTPGSLPKSSTTNNEKEKATPTVGRLSKSKINAINIPMLGGPPRAKDTDSKPQVKKGKPPPKINIHAATVSDHQSQAHAQMSEKAKATRVAPKSVNPDEEDWDYFYQLALQYDKFKLQEVEETKNLNKLPISEAKQQKKTTKKPHIQGDKENITNSLEGLFGGTNYTANGKFLNDAFFDQYLVENPKFSSVTLDFSSQSKLYKRFDRKDQEQRNISQMFAAALLKHPRASKITHLAMSNALLPDAFLVALADQCLAIGGSGLPMLQVLNLESNLLGKDGIAALSKCIADPKVWCRLQILKLENQKSKLTSDTEDLLGEAVVQSPSLVMIGLRVRGGIPKQQIDNTVTTNVDKLRQARRKHASKTGALKARKRNEMEEYFDKIAANTDSSIVDVDLTGNLKFLGLNATERIKSGAAFGNNKTVKTVKMVKLKLDDDFAEAFGKALATNTTLETVILDSNSFSGTGVKALLKGLGMNKSIANFQIRHQSKTMSSSDEETLPELLKDNTAVIKLGIDARNQLIKMQLDRKTNENREYQRKQRVAAARQKK